MTIRKRITIIIGTIAILVIWNIYAIINPIAGDWVSGAVFDYGRRFAFIPYVFGVLMGRKFWKTRYDWNIPFLVFASGIMLVASFLLKIEVSLAFVMGLPAGHYFWGTKE